MGTVQTSNRGDRASLVVLGWLAVAWLLVLTAWLFSPDHNTSGRCEGIGFGCTLTPRDTVLFAAVIVGIPATLATSTVGLAAVGFVTVHGRLLSWGALGLGTLATATGLAITLVGAVVLLGLGSVL